MVIDIHTHAWPDKVALKAKTSLESFFKIRLAGDGTVTGLLASMDANNVDVSVICAVASRPEQVRSINSWLFGVRSQRIRVFAALHPGYAQWKEELSLIRAHGDGVKFQPEFQNFYVDDPAVFPVYELLQELALPVLFHCGEELSGTLLVRSSPDRIWKIRQSFPKLRIIAAHFGGFRLWPEVEKHLLGRDVYLDTSYFFSFLPPKEIKRMLELHSPDRLLFGSDFPIAGQRSDLEFLRALDIAPQLKEKILCRNAQQVLGIA
ncbi:MAG TPA: amidohydrolase family protein [Candidatus Omnitrophota bacterium]|nr:amidohydrolase family protein [Candidatus Omnitrophota bacterium]HRZ14176.1 amidohydrolase family protein [Candidatus Omnitrophota bacterium]